MLDLEGIFKNESVEDVLLHFAPRTPYPSIDRMYVNYKFDIVADGILLNTYQRLISEGKLLEKGCDLPERGPKWNEPKFVTERKYGVK